MASLKQKKKQRAALDSLFWFMVGGGLVFGVLLLLVILAQNSDLSSQLAASVPSGSPSGSPTTTDLPHSCYYNKDSCYQAPATMTAKECDRLKGGAEHYSYFAEDRKCLEKNYVLDRQIASSEGYSRDAIDCGMSWDTPMTTDVRRFCDRKLEKALNEENAKGPCAQKGSWWAWWGPAQYPYYRSWKIAYKPILGCETVCTRIRRCVVESPNPIPN